MPKEPLKISHSHICDLLYSKHSEDVCVPECNIGSSTQDRQHQRIDFWAMKRSWTYPVVWAYEIKTRRADFLQDNKWPGYLPYCTDFYFITVPDVIEPEELPKEAGLIVCSKNAKRLYTKKKAPHRDVAIPDRIFRYILMSRASIDSTIVDPYPKREYDIEYYRNMIRDQEEGARVGGMIAHKISYGVSKKTREIQRENQALQNKIQSYDTFVEWLEGLGLQKDGLGEFRTIWELQRKLSRSVNILSTAKNKSTVAIRAVQEIQKALQIELEKPNESEQGQGNQKTLRYRN